MKSNESPHNPTHAERIAACFHAAADCLGTIADDAANDGEHGIALNARTLAAIQRGMAATDYHVDNPKPVNSDNE